MKKRDFLKAMNLVRILTVGITLFVIVNLTSSSLVSITLNDISKKQVINLEAIEKEPSSKFKPSAGLAPNIAVKDYSVPTVSLPTADSMWGYIVNSSVYDEGTCYFDIEDPSDITYLNDTQSDEFLSGGTGVNEKWIACENSTGALWEIDPVTGDMTYIGGGGVGLNGLAMDYINNFLFGASGSGLYLIDPEDGSQEFIGDFGSGVNEMIGIASNGDGEMYGWDLGDKLWIIDKETGEATEIGPLGIDLNYAQDGDFDWDYDILYLTAFIVSPYYGSYLCSCNLETGECTVVDQFAGNSQITASVIYFGCPPSPRDVGIKDILRPNNGYAWDEMKVTVQVKDYRNLTEEDVPVTVAIFKDGVEEEYNETEYFDIGWGQTVNVEMPSWMPDDLYSVNNEYIDYKITAYTTLSNDYNPDNDYKQKWIELYFPYLHDVGAFTLGEMEDGPAQTFETKAMIKNVGQYDECCFKTHVQVSEIDFSSADYLLFEDFSPYYYFPPTGWTRTTTKWTGSSYNYCQQGDGGEARFYNYSSDTSMFRLYSPPINTTGYGAVSISFVHYLNHYNGPYTLRIETSPDGLTWSSVWELINPDDIFTPEWVNITTYTNVGGDNFHVSITFDGCSWNTNWWHVDSVSVYGFPIKEPELTDEMCIQEIIPGEELILEFDDWTPEFLQYETSGVKTYAAKVWTQLDDPEDNHRANDQFQKGVELQYFHDVGVQQVSSPVGRSYRIFYAVQGGYPGTCVWFDPDTPNIHNSIGTFPSNNFPQGATFVRDVMWLCDTTGKIYKKENPMSPDAEYVGNAGTGELFALAWHEPSRTLYGGSSQNLYEIDMDTGKATLIGPFQQAGYYMISMDCDKDGVMYGYDLNYADSQLYTINLETGRATAIGNIGISAMYGQDMAYDWEYDTMYACGYDTSVGPGFYEINLETGQFTKLGNLPTQTTCLAITFDPCIKTYISPGNCSIEIIVANLGTFPEVDMTAYATIDEYITNCIKPTPTGYNDTIKNIDIKKPLTGTKTLTFANYNFSEEGQYVLIFEIVDDNDDKIKNNVMKWEVRCDDTHPTSSYILDPDVPDGKNGWYVSDLNVTLYAEDPSIGCGHPGSGIKEIKYTINDVGDTIPGSVGTFTVTYDGNDIVVEYWAIDNVGNVESKNSFTIDMDQTLPVIDDDGVHWKAFRENPLSNIWYVRFWTNATDATSDMDRVEMYINEGLHETNANPDGARYDFVIMWSTVLETVTFSWRHYDRAGWYTYDEIKGDEPSSKSYSSETRKSNQKQVTPLKIFSIKGANTSFSFFY